MLSQCLLPHVALPSTNGEERREREGGKGGEGERGRREEGERGRRGRREEGKGGEGEGRSLAAAQVMAVSGHLTNLGVLGEDGTMFVEYQLVIMRVTRLEEI